MTKEEVIAKENARHARRMAYLTAQKNAGAIDDVELARLVAAENAAHGRIITGVEEPQ